MITQKVGRNDMLCACGSVLSAVTFTCVRGEHCPNYSKPKVGRTRAAKAYWGAGSWSGKGESLPQSVKEILS